MNWARFFLERLLNLIEGHCQYMVSHKPLEFRETRDFRENYQMNLVFVLGSDFQYGFTNTGEEDS